MNEEGADVPSEVQGKLRQFKRVLISYIDFVQAGGIASHILEMRLHERYPTDRFLLQGLNCGMILAYCRPFSGNDRHSQYKIPDLPARILSALTPEERELHDVVMKDRDTVLAHSDSEAWEPEPQIHRVGREDILVPMFNYVHAPLTRRATELLRGMCDKLMEACLEHRTRMAVELRPYFPIVRFDERVL